VQTNRPSRSHGFTLVELLVVIVIIAVLVAISATAVIRFRSSGDRTVTLGAMRQLQIANISYATDNSGYFVPLVATVGGYNWFENPDFISHLIGATGTISGGVVPNDSIPVGLNDASVVRKNSAKNTTLGNSFGYSTQSGSPAFKQARVSNPSSSAAFITCDVPFITHPTKASIAYRHQDKALVVYYDGRAAVITKADVTQIDAKGGATNPFWKADSN
jgi:prepilin-type N-terminal cleavage/methylation domain-containing protein